MASEGGWTGEFGMPLAVPVMATTYWQDSESEDRDGGGGVIFCVQTAESVFLSYQLPAMPFRAKTLQITWHAKSGSKNDPILSIDFHPTLPLFATAGADHEIKVWALREPGAAGVDPSRVDPSVEYLFTLTGHDKTVNTVRFSPNGECLASVSDGAFRLWGTVGGRSSKCPPSQALTHKENTPLFFPHTHAHAHNKFSAHGRPLHWHMEARKQRVVGCRHLCKAPLPQVRLPPKLHPLTHSTPLCFPLWPTSLSLTPSKSAPSISSLTRPAPHPPPPQTHSPTPMHLSLRGGHKDDVFDVAWSPDSRHVVTGSVDNTAIVWDVARERMVASLEGHSQFVQGVAWDPSGQYLVTQSNDRTVRVYLQKGVGLPAPTHTAKGKAAAAKASTSAKFACKAIHVIRSREVEVEGGGGGGSSSSSSSSSSEAAAGATAPAEGGAGAAAAALSATAPKPGAPWKHHLFGDETVPSFFRRPTFSPDATLLFTPTGHFRASPTQPSRPTTYAFAPAQGFGEPLAHFPVATTAKPSIAVRVSPILFRLRSSSASSSTAVAGGGGAEPVPPSSGTSVGSPNPSFSLPYRMLVAIATLDAVVVYDTECAYPVAAVANMHYDKITDLAWSPSGRVLLLASIDGYCSMLQFDEADVGERLPLEDHPPLMRWRRHGPTYPPPRQSKAAKAAAAAASAGAAGGSEAHPADENAISAAEPKQAIGGKRKLAATLLVPAEGGLADSLCAPPGVPPARAAQELSAHPLAAAVGMAAAVAADAPLPMQEEAPPAPALQGFLFGGGGALASILASTGTK
jgi:chromatin assembly factor 1 subunit B